MRWSVAVKRDAVETCAQQEVLIFVLLSGKAKVARHCFKLREQVLILFNSTRETQSCTEEALFETQAERT